MSFLRSQKAIKMENTLTAQDKFAIWDEFLKEWPLERVRKMTLQEYTEAGSQDTFTYWMEARLADMGSIWGGSAFKFGVYSRRDTKHIPSDSMRSYDDHYGWYTSRGETPQAAFEQIRADIVAIIEAVQQGDLKKIDENQLGEIYKWKIAFHYQSRETPVLISVFMKDALLVYLGEENRSVSMSELYTRIMNNRGSKEIFDLSREIWEKWEMIKPMRFWKISHGTDAQSGERREELFQHKLIAVHGDTAKSQGSNFINELQIGDYFYLCYGNKIQILGKIESDAEECDLLDDGWYCRRYSIVKQIDGSHAYTGIKKGWTPNYLSTCKLIPRTELNLFEENILQPFFDMKLIDFKGEAMNEEIMETLEPEMPAKTVKPDIPLNLILYGPPGTGKTYELNRLKAYFTETKQGMSDEAWMDQTIGQMTWWEVIVAVMSELKKPSTVAEIFEHPFIASKCRTLNKTKNIKQQVWAALQTHTPPESKTVNYKTRVEPHVFDKQEKSQWVLLQGWETECSDILGMVAKYKNNRPAADTVERFKFLTFHQSYSYEEFVEGIRAVVDDEDPNAPVRYEVQPGIFWEMCEKARNDRDHHYALFIDEINRGNISKIFGELITLIEEDKRDDHENQENQKIIVTLPYSKSPFAVPSNLHIIGTMNTADRSIAHMDTALRRRFEFKEMMPDPRKLKDIDMSDEGIDIPQMFYTMNKRIEVLYDREHTIGHAYFMPLLKNASLKTLQEIFTFKILPLLQEYFFEDWAKIRIVLGDNQKDTEYQFIQKRELSSDWFGGAELGYTQPAEYIINREAFSQVDTYVGIYETAPEKIDFN